MKQLGRVKRQKSHFTDGGAPNHIFNEVRWGSSFIVLNFADEYGEYVIFPHPILNVLLTVVTIVSQNSKLKEP